MGKAVFLAKLEQEAARQAKLYHQRVLPPQLDRVTTLIGKYPWQVILILSGFTAVFMELSKLFKGGSW